MKLLVITQKVDNNDPVLGFFHQWLIEFASKVETLFVICLCAGEYDLPQNVKVFSLGKENNTSRLGYILKFYKILWQLRGQYDAVFVHMNQVYVLLAGMYWRLKQIPVGLWYSHRAKTFSLWLAEKFTNIIFTNTTKSFTVASKKIIALGHGINIGATSRPESFSVLRGRGMLLSVGRITPIKDQETILRACGILARNGTQFNINFVGGAATQSDEVYTKKLAGIVSEEKIVKYVKFNGNIPQRDLFPYYWKSEIHVNACPTGGMDKVVLEAAIGGAIPLATNESFRDFLGIYANRLFFETANSKNLAEKLEALLASQDQEEIRIYLKKRAIDNFDLRVLVKKIINWYETSR